MKQKTIKTIETWLSQKRKSDSGWADITSEDVAMLKNINALLIEEKCQADADGDRPFQVIINNRKNNWPIHYFAIRYHHRLGDDELQRELGLGVANVRMAMEGMETLLREIEYRRKQVTKSKDGSADG